MNGPWSSNAKRKREDEVDEEDSFYYDDNGGYMDDEDEPHKFGTSALPVANLPNSFDGIPQDGLEYLFTVRREEKQLPFVTRAPNPYAVQNPTPLEIETNVGKSGNKSLNLIPSEEWRTCFQMRFLNLRANIQQPTIHIVLPNMSPSGSSKLPEMRDRDRWWAFFRGDVDWENIPSSQFHGKNAGGNDKRKRETVEYEEALPREGGKMRGWVVYEEKLSWDQAEDEVTALKYGCGDEDQSNDGELPEEPLIHKGKRKEDGGLLAFSNGSPLVVTDDCSSVPDNPRSREPTSYLLSLLDQKTTFHLLKYFTQWIQGHFDCSFLPAPPPCHPELHESRFYDFTTSHARWIFALLSRLDAQLTSDEISVLRKLAREILRLIKEERSSQSVTSTPSMRETACWMIVAAITGVWGQKDLWMDAADILQ